MEVVPAGTPGRAGTGRIPVVNCMASKTMMPPVLIIEKQNEIIQLQSQLIADLYNELAQHTAVGNAEKELEKIEALKKEIGE